MCTDRRLVANRRNAVRSTGPRSVAGMERAARNALKHGLWSGSALLPGVERAEEWEVHRASVVAGLQPVGGVELALAERAAQLLWRLARVPRYEAAVVAVQLAEASVPERGACD